MISVCMASYNGEKYIKDQITSILSQLDNNDELIISDDGSTDDTLNIINKLKELDSRIILLNHTKPDWIANIKKSRNFYYTTYNFENALKHTKGDYIFLADQDDLWNPRKIELTLPLLDQHQIVMSNYAIIDTDGIVLKEKFLDKSPISNRSLFYNVLKSKYLGCTMAFTRNILEKVLPFPQGVIAHDLWIGCLNYKKVFFLDESLQLYRRHEGTVSTAANKSPNGLIYKFLYRIIFMKKILFKK